MGINFGECDVPLAGAHIVKVETEFLVLCRLVSHNRRGAFGLLSLIERG